MMLLRGLLSLLGAVAAAASDPSGGWLSYAVYNAPRPTDTITRMSATTVVPPAPSDGGGSPAFWFGLQTASGDGALVQPITSKWLGDGFYMFQEIFDWTDYNDHQTTPIRLRAGDVVHAEVAYVKTSNSYRMTMNATGSDEVSRYEYKLLQTKTEAQAYFVLEHQPQSCDELPPSGVVSWTNIEIEVNNERVENPRWTAKQENPKCGSKATVVSSHTVNITWDASAVVADAAGDLPSTAVFTPGLGNISCFRIPAVVQSNPASFWLCRSAARIVR